ncbi:MAG: adenylyltransferase/cytidyltransferase family protein [Candidatus Rokubacteria bacterium]|nr:adenylyltransferase/cytidyltransferase family protein [Candidatus Rokubacteria bacterium]
MAERAVADKVKALPELAPLVAAHKAAGRRVVHCHGVFDLIHPGHIRHLQAARREGDVLIVTLTPDHFVNKGPGRPAFTQQFRAELIAAMECVDYVAVNAWPTAVETIRLLKPDVYVKGSDYATREDDVTGKIYEEEQAVVAAGGRIHFTYDITFSSSQLINQHFEIFPPETEEWLRRFRARWAADDLLARLESTRTLRALVIGEAIVDEYVFCDALGKSSKDPILAFRYGTTESYAGGSLAVANHLAGFCDDVGIVTQLGEARPREDFIRKALHERVRPHFLVRSGAPTIHKRRFIDAYTNARLLELYVMDDGAMTPPDEANLVRTLEEQIGRYDVVIVTDYGHGMLSPAAISLLCDKARFLAVNTQANAGNRGFNTISKYPRADYVCLANHEVQLETRMRHAEARDLILEVTKKITCPRFTVTQGKNGSLHYDPESGFTEVPALATRITDRVGAGDAVLAVTSLLVAQGAPWEVVGLIGNLAGAHMVAELGNRLSISRAPLAKHLISLLK